MVITESTALVLEKLDHQKISAVSIGSGDPSSFPLPCAVLGVVAVTSDLADSVPSSHSSHVVLCSHVRPFCASF